MKLEDLRKLLNNELSENDRAYLEKKFDIEIEENVNREDNVFIQIHNLKSAIQELEIQAIEEFTNYGFYGLSSYFDAVNDSIDNCNDIELFNMLNREKDLMAIEFPEVEVA